MLAAWICFRRLFTTVRETRAWRVSMILESLFHRIVAIAGILQSITDQAESRVRRVVPSFFYFSLFFRCVICLQYLEPPSIRWTAVDGEGTRRRFGASRSAASPVRRRTFKEISIIYKRYRLPRDVQWSFNNAEEDVTERKERDSFVTRGKLISQTLRNKVLLFSFLSAFNAVPGSSNFHYLR